MAVVPFLGRLFFREYLALLGSFILLGLEVVVRVITLALPERLIRILYNQSRRTWKSLASPSSRRNRDKTRNIVDPIAQAADFTDLCQLFGYYAEEHVVQTCDGYLLGLHRLAWRKGEEDKRVNAGPTSVSKKVAYLHHGLMMNSEVWVCLSDKERCLPFQLVEKGYDVWLGNNRGNKYSKKSVHYSPSSTKFWDFSIDQFAFHDIPDTINYILETTGQKSLSYIGFSQGTAQAFATLSIHPTLNDKVDVFVALAPAMSPPGLQNGIVSSLVKASPEVLFLAFGRRSILASSTMWQALLYPPIFVRCIDIALSFLFGWKTQNISPHQKLAAYPHLYSFASTKCVVHWFQIITAGVFQMYDDEVQGPMSVSGGRRYYKVAKFPTRNIKTPVVLVWGGSDSLVNIDVMLKELPNHTVAKKIPHYEHLDFLWASDVDKQVFPHVFDALEFHTTSKNKLEAGTHHRIPSINGPPSYSDEEQLVYSRDRHSSITGALNGGSCTFDGTAERSDFAAITSRAANQGSKMTGPSHFVPDTSHVRPVTPQGTEHGTEHGTDSRNASSSPMSVREARDLDRYGNSQSPFERSVEPPSRQVSQRKHGRRASVGSTSSTTSTETRFSPRGIDLGVGKTASSLSNVDGANWRATEKSVNGRGKRKDAKV